jgi:hypothetical protein
MALIKTMNTAVEGQQEFERVFIRIGNLGLHKLSYQDTIRPSAEQDFRQGVSPAGDIRVAGTPKSTSLR